jgi:hypothetical protein
LARAAAILFSSLAAIASSSSCRAASKFSAIFFSRPASSARAFANSASDFSFVLAASRSEFIKAVSGYAVPGGNAPPPTLGVVVLVSPEVCGAEVRETNIGFIEATRFFADCNDFVQPNFSNIVLFCSAVS